MSRTEYLDYLQIRLAAPTTIHRWSQRRLPDGSVVGQVTKADTINYRTFKPERHGLFCERIFGSMVTGECACGKTRRRKLFKPVDQETSGSPGLQPTDPSQLVCPNCGVQPTNAKARRYRMGQIGLGKPVAHIWYFRNTPNTLATLLDVAAAQTSYIIHFHYYLAAKPNVLSPLVHPGSWWDIDNWDSLHIFFNQPVRAEREFDEPAPWNPNERVFPDYLHTIENCGAEAFQMLLSNMDLDFIEHMLTIRLAKVMQAHQDYQKELKTELVTQLVRDLAKRRKKDTYAHVSSTKLLANRTHRLDLPSDKDSKARLLEFTLRIKKIAKRLHCLRLLRRKDLRPEWMILSTFPVLPPDLRPMIQMSSGRFAASDMNDLYRRLIYRKLRFDKFCSIFDPEFLPDLLIRHDLCLLQEAADAIIDNGRLEKPAQRPNRTNFKSLTAIIEGKQGRFRQNLLGKRVDYSGRSVIVVGPKLRLHQCGLPREMALELFHPFLLQVLIESSLAKNIRNAKALLQQRPPAVWRVLEEVIQAHPILLNRAPTLHRLGIQAFEPILLTGRAIQLHPLVCPAFNADFDGDQMAVHVPLSLEAQVEARLLMLASHNWLSPATGDPSITPSQDMILGFYYLTAGRPPQLQPRSPRQTSQYQARLTPEVRPDLRVFTSLDDVIHAHTLHQLALHESVWVRWPVPFDGPAPRPLEVRIETGGRVTSVYHSYVTETIGQLQVGALAACPPPLSDGHGSPRPYPTHGLDISTMKPTSTTYIRTTPGRAILNQLIYENLFL